jgi:hypothetical protein
MTEQQIHRGIVDYLTTVLPDGSVLHHSPNEGKHRVQYRVMQKRLGMRAGWPDLELFVLRTWWHPDVRWSPIFLEIKTAKGRLSDKQKDVHADLILAGCQVGVVRSIADTRNYLLKFIELCDG